MNEDKFVNQLKENILDIAGRCRNCNYCYSVCPLFESTRGFQVQGPSGILQAISYAIKWGEIEGNEKEILRDILYSCTTCYSCVLKCKSRATGVPILEAIEGGRRLLVELMIGPMPKQIKVLESLEQEGNPYDELASKRLDWLKDLRKERSLNNKLLPRDKAEILLYVGCTASYDVDLRNVAPSIVGLLEAIGADYGILEQEKCCGYPAKKMGEEGLFNDLAQNNLEKFNESGVQTILTISPHCSNTFINEYPEGIKKFKIQHYTEFFAEMIGRKGVNPKSRGEKVITYQDPCDLGKRQGVYDAPRKILKSLQGVSFVEMKRNRENSLCCGGGGGRMWIETEEIPRLSETRVKEALTLGAEIIATACPWCHIQLEDAIKTTRSEGKIKVKDVAELLAESI